MEDRLTHDVRAVAARFLMPGEFISAEPFGGGHIHDTYRAVFDQAGRPVRYLVQRINPHVFRQPAALMQNIERVTAHLAARLAGQPDASRRVLTLIPAREGRNWHVDASGHHWRAYRFIERAHTRDTAESTGQAFEAARAFGQFQRLLADLPAPRLHDTIPGFHHTPGRFAAFEAALAADGAGRAAAAAAEIEFARRHQPLATALIEANLPGRVTHNDTKLNNVLLDDATGEGLCVIDLDTVMPGLALHDFGDLVRTATSPAPEDERDLTRVGMRLPMFEALARGYLEGTGSLLTPEEKRLLPVAGKLITYETGLRFLTDFLAGDVYFKVHRAGHNLDRCRTQFRLVESITRQEAEMNRLVAAI